MQSVEQFTTGKIDTKGKRGTADGLMFVKFSFRQSQNPILIMFPDETDYGKFINKI